MLMQHRGPDAKAVVWAHNSHIGNAAATAMGWQGEFNIGELARNAYRDDAVSIGFGTDRGTVMAASDWDGPAETKTVRPAREDSYEYLFRRTGLARSLTDWRLPARRDLRDGTHRSTARARDRRGLPAGVRVAQPLFRSRAAGAVRRVRLVRGDACGDAAGGATGTRRGGHLSVRVVTMASGSNQIHDVSIGPHRLAGRLGVPRGASGLVIFAHGSGSGRHSPRNNQVAAGLREAGFATLLLDLLSPEEERDRRNVFDIALLASRLAEAAEWAQTQPELAHLAIGYFGASTGAAAALVAAAEGQNVAAIVSRGGRPDLAGSALRAVSAPTLLIVGGADIPVIPLNRAALRAAQLREGARDRAGRDSSV